MAKAYKRVSFVFLGLALRHAKVPFDIIWWILRFLLGIPQMLMGDSVAGPYFDGAPGIRQGDPVCPAPIVFS